MGLLVRGGAAIATLVAARLDGHTGARHRHPLGDDDCSILAAGQHLALRMMMMTMFMLMITIITMATIIIASIGIIVHCPCAL